MSVTLLRVHVTPRAGRNEIAGWRADELSIRVAVPPEAGKANAAVCRVVSESLGVPKSAVRVRRGETSRHKTLMIEGVSAGEIEGVFGAPS
jgi:uncharacterized protein (TIGR00251 family)